LEAVPPSNEAARHIAEVVLDVAHATSTSLELKHVLKVLARRAAQSIGAARCSINVWRDGRLVPVMSQFADGHEDPTLWSRYRAIGSHPLEEMPLTAEAIRTRQPVVIDDVLTTERLAAHWREVYRGFGVRAVLTVPLLRQDAIVGTMSLDQSDGPWAWSRTQIELAVAIGGHAALVVDNARLYEDAQRRLGHTTALLEMASVLNSTLELKPLLKDIAARAAQGIGVDRCSIFLCQKDGTLQAVMSQFADGHADPEQWARFKAAAGRTGEVRAFAEALRFAQPVVIQDAAASPLISDWWRRTFSITSMLVVPLVRKDVAVGVLHLSNTTRKRPITEDQVTLAQTIATQVALAIDNAQLYDQVRGQLQQLRETQAQLLQAGKLAAVGQLSAGVAHEVNNPLAIVIGQAELLRLKSADPVVAEKVDKIVRAATRAARIVKGLQTFAKPQAAELAAVYLPDVVERVVAVRRETLRVSGIALEQEVAAGLPPVWGDQHQLEQMVLNLILNAEQALTGTSARPRIGLTITATEAGVRLTVSDTGPGIAPETVPRLFEPFFTTKPVGQGTGLGLSIAYGIVVAHGGRIRAESVPGHGATLIVELPAHAPDHPVEPAPASPTASEPGRGRVLVIDDEEDVAETLRALLESLGLSVEVALGGVSGWERLTTPTAHYDLVTLDLKMPDLSGPRLWERLVAVGSPLVARVVFVTGDSLDGGAWRFLEQAGRPVMSKPFDLANLEAFVSRQLGSPLP
jgi:signal transduction histidine kinase/ActR/RegA family two-component response regulator